MTALSLAFSVNTLAPRVGFGEKLAVVPLGRPRTDSVTGMLNPVSGVTVTVETLDAP
jgi:hypothetical protein